MKIRWGELRVCFKILACQVKSSFWKLEVKFFALKSKALLLDCRCLVKLVPQKNLCRQVGALSTVGLNQGLQSLFGIGALAACKHCLYYFAADLDCPKTSFETTMSCSPCLVT